MGDLLALIGDVYDDNPKLARNVAIGVFVFLCLMGFGGYLWIPLERVLFGVCGVMGIYSLVKNNANVQTDSNGSNGSDRGINDILSVDELATRQPRHREV